MVYSSLVVDIKQKWSPDWKSSKQPRKQRKYRHNAPLHVKRHFLSVNLAKPLRERFGKRSILIRKGDEARIMVGKFKGKSGPVERVDIKNEKVYIEGIKVEKVDGSSVSKPIAPSNLMITKLKIDDKRRQAVLERSGSTGKSIDKKVVKKEEKKGGE